MIRLALARVGSIRRMVPIIAVIALLTVAVLAVFNSAAAAAPATPHFGPNVMITQTPAYTAGNPSIAVGSDGVAYLAFAGWAGPTTGTDVFFTKSANGRTWTPPVRVNNDATAFAQTNPSLALDSGNNISIAWVDGRSGNQDIWFSRSTNGGQSFSPNVLVNLVTTNAQTEVRIAVDPVDPMLIHAVWTDTRVAGNPDIYAVPSTNGGVSFGANVKVNDDVGPVWQLQPSLAANGGKIVVAWADMRTGGSTNVDIYASTSLDGLTWSANVKLNDDSSAASQFQPTVGMDSPGDVFAAWFDTRGSGQDVYGTVLDVVVPVSRPGAGSTGDQGAAIVFNASASTDNLGIASYAWDFGDGSGATGSTGSHTYANAGMYTAALTVWDYSGNSAMSTMTVTVRDTKAPVPLGGGDRSVDETQSLFFDASASTDNVGVVSYAWDFGDGSSASTATANHVYAHPGVYQATLTVTDAAGNSATSSFHVTVRSSPLLGWIEILAGIVAVLTIAVILMGWMAWGKRNRDQKESGRPSAERQAQPPPPPRDSDPLDMSFPPAPPKDP